MRESGRRIFLAGGGTGGHLYTGLAVAEAIFRRRPETSVAFSCTRGEIDAKILRGRGFPVTAIDSRPFRLRAPWTWPRFLASLVLAGNHARRRFREFCPDVVLGLGGYGSYAPVRVGQKYGAATVILNPDIVPGRANRRLARRADAVFCQFPPIVDAFGNAARLTGCPVRASVLGRDRAKALAAFGLDAARRTL
ncbi:MAG: UDP-N-acetylglucosamine--N-acetylmuramyl-(pentapeptide) pyrophosphoryl-undecaprenol N-acetylglucosamine transferase, partial [Phycisphaerae bacterium]